MLFEPVGAGNPLKAQEDQDSVPTNIPHLLSSCKRRVLLASLEGILLHFLQIEADFKSNSTTHLIVIIIPAIIIIIFKVITITNTEMFMERSLEVHIKLAFQYLADCQDRYDKKIQVEGRSHQTCKQHGNLGQGF